MRGKGRTRGWRERAFIGVAEIKGKEEEEKKDGVRVRLCVPLSFSFSLSRFCSRSLCPSLSRVLQLSVVQSASLRCRRAPR